MLTPALTKTVSRLTPFDATETRCVDPINGRFMANAVDQMVANGVNVPEIARRTGIDKTNIYAYRRGHQTPKVGLRPTLIRVFAGVGVSLTIV